jgi:hypothetical protein
LLARLPGLALVQHAREHNGANRIGQRIAHAWRIKSMRRFATEPGSLS